MDEHKISLTISKISVDNKAIIKFQPSGFHPITRRVIPTVVSTIIQYSLDQRGEISFTIRSVSKPAARPCLTRSISGSMTSLEEIDHDGGVLHSVLHRQMTPLTTFYPMAEPQQATFYVPDRNRVTDDQFASRIRS
jgi:hypothetical protein